MSFENIIGNEKNKFFLNRLIDSGNIVHSYMFEGIEGIGKFLFAKEFAKMILCMGDNKKNCNICKSCIEFKSDNNPDFKIIEPEGKIIKIDLIRQMQEKLLEKPIISNKKVYIINDADLMTKEAQNCLLKTLEEPPNFIVIILVLSNEGKILNTVKSRCMRINFDVIDKQDLKKFLQQNIIKNNVTDEMIENSGGSILKLIEVNDNALIYDDILKFINMLQITNILDVINNAEFLYKNKDYIENILEFMECIFYKKLINEKNNKYINVIQELEDAKNNLRQSCNYDMTIDHLIFKIWEEVNENSSRNKI